MDSWSEIIDPVIYQHRPWDIFERSFKVSGFSVQEITTNDCMRWDEMIVFLTGWTIKQRWYFCMCSCKCSMLLIVMERLRSFCVDSQRDTKLSTWNKHIMLKLFTQKWQICHYLFMRLTVVPHVINLCLVLSTHNICAAVQNLCVH